MVSTAMPDIRTLAPAVATCLGAGWKSEPHPEHPHASALLTHEDGRQVSLYVDQYASPRAARVQASGQEPTPPVGILAKSTRIDFGHITMAATKSARQIAADVSRRLLPTLAASLVQWQARMDQLCAEEAQRTAAADCLAAALRTTSVTRASHGSTWDKRKLHMGWAGTARGTERQWMTTPRASVEVDADSSSGAYVKIELSGLTAAQAERVLRALLDEEQHGGPSDS
ncbi:hypothetical protein [Streptomyces clavifer]|uniref:hypothetical protein n=1 Tax=Streptomyces clavifer TaxID=68188 RepID=UPI00342C73AD